ncbi:DMT family transporter [Romboutsia weinsteinii]|uniref:DMT family transporter n=1 Tax=Romboutsia weinsteinii TaxID=2020949 RepID=A0A371J1X6_9FIRM|nr:DMT family transporter [Romboutsia weinsteinii]RDY26780.1 DMT family transporter [Romboutsia weinsteinii]
MTKKHSGEIGLIAVAIIWGSGFVGTQLSLDGGFRPIQILTLRFLLSTIILNIIFFKQIKENLCKGILISGSILGAVLCLSFAAQTVGLVYTTPSKNAFITAANVVIVPFIGFILYKRKLDKIGIISSIVALIGIGVLSLDEGVSVNIGDFLTLICAIGFAFHIFLTREFTLKYNSIALTSIQFMSAFLLSLILQIISGEGKIVATSAGYLGVIYLAIFGTTIGFLLQTICQKKVDGTKTAIILSTEAVFGTIFSIIILGEVITIKMIIGCILILGAIISAETKLSFLKPNKPDVDYSNDNT